MVAPKDVDFGRIFDFEGEQQADGLDALPPSIHIISQEEIAGLRRQSAVFEEPQHVVILSVDVSADLDRRSHL